MTDAPVAVGGIGGSGTRLVANLLLEAGYFLGPELNKSYDNLWFTQFFYGNRRGRPVAHPVRRARAFAECMTATGFPGWKAASTALGVGVARAGRLEGGRVVRTVRAIGHRGRAVHARGGQSRAAIARGVRMARGARYVPASYRGWGWKEPVTHVYVDALSDAFPRLRYVHVMRHGVDMAYSSRQDQVRGGWLPLFGIAPVRPGASVDEVAAASLAYWARANRWVVDTATARLGDRFLLLRLEDLCARPAEGVDRLCRFLEVDPPPELHERLVALPVMPSTVGRYLGRDLSVFDRTDLATVEAFGYAIER